MKLLQLQYFISTVKYNSISRAAKEEFVSQPAVSLAIKELEEEFNTIFFIRNNNQLTLTEEGKHFYTLSKSLIAHSNRMKNEMYNYLRKEEILKIGIPPMLGTFIIPKILREFSKIYPSIQVDVTEYGSVETIKAVIEEDIDISLTVIYDGKIDSSLDYIKIGETKLQPAISNKNVLANQDTIEIKDLYNVPLILMKEDTLQSQIIKQLFQHEGINPLLKIRSNQLFTIIELLEKGNYCAFLFDKVIKNDDIVFIPFKEEIKFDIVVVWNKKSILSNISKEFINFMKEFKL